MEAPGTLPVEPIRLWRLKVPAYHRMIDAGILREDDRVELLEGVLIAMTPQSVPHARIIQRLNRWLSRSLGDDLTLRPQLPLTLGDDSEPEPDFAVVQASMAERGATHPTTALLVIEVAGSSLAYDRGPKAATTGMRCRLAEDGVGVAP